MKHGKQSIGNIKEILSGDRAGRRSRHEAIADPECNFVHIGISCKLDQEIEFYTSGAQFLSLKKCNK